MTNTAEQFIETNRAFADALQSMATHAFAGFERLVELNMNTSKVAMVDSFRHAQAVLDVKDAQQLLALQAGRLQPRGMKYVSYAGHVYDIFAESGTKIIKTFTAAVENVEKYVPPGTETAVAILKSAVVASQKAIETAQGTAKTAVELAESSLTAVAGQAANSAANASKKR